MTTQYELKNPLFARPYLGITAGSKLSLAEQIAVRASFFGGPCEVLMDGQRVGQVERYEARHGSRFPEVDSRIVVRFTDNTEPGYLWLADRSEAVCLA